MGTGETVRMIDSAVIRAHSCTASPRCRQLSRLRSHRCRPAVDACIRQRAPGEPMVLFIAIASQAGRPCRGSSARDACGPGTSRKTQSQASPGGPSRWRMFPTFGTGDCAAASNHRDNNPLIIPVRCRRPADLPDNKSRRNRPDIRAGRSDARGFTMPHRHWGLLFLSWAVFSGGARRAISCLQSGRARHILCYARF